MTGAWCFLYHKNIIMIPNEGLYKPKLVDSPMYLLVLINLQVYQQFGVVFSVTTTFYYKFRVYFGLQDHIIHLQNRSVFIDLYT